MYIHSLPHPSQYLFVLSTCFPFFCPFSFSPSLTPSCFLSPTVPFFLVSSTILPPLPPPTVFVLLPSSRFKWPHVRRTVCWMANCDGNVSTWRSSEDYWLVLNKHRMQEVYMRCTHVTYTLLSLPVALVNQCYEKNNGNLRGWEMVLWCAHII